MGREHIIKVKLNLLISTFFFALSNFILPIEGWAQSPDLREARDKAVKKWSDQQQKNYPPEIRNIKQLIKANENRLIPLYEPWVNSPSFKELERDGIPLKGPGLQLEQVYSFHWEGQFYVIGKYGSVRKNGSFEIEESVLYVKKPSGFTPVKLVYQGSVSDIQLIKPGSKAPVFLLTTTTNTINYDYALLRLNADGTATQLENFGGWYGGIAFLDLDGSGHMEIIDTSRITEFPASLREALKDYPYNDEDVNSIPLVKELNIYKWNGTGFKRTGSYIVGDNEYPW